MGWVFFTVEHPKCKRDTSIPFYPPFSEFHSWQKSNLYCFKFCLCLYLSSEEAPLKKSVKCGKVNFKVNRQEHPNNKKICFLPVFMILPRHISMSIKIKMHLKLETDGFHVYHVYACCHSQFFSAPQISLFLMLVLLSCKESWNTVA